MVELNCNGIPLIVLHLSKRTVSKIVVQIPVVQTELGLVSIPGPQETYLITIPKYGSSVHHFFEPLAPFLISAIIGSVSPPTEKRSP